MEGGTRSLLSGLWALALALLAVLMLWVPFVLTSGSAGGGRWWAWLIWVAVVPAGLLLAGSCVLIRAALQSMSGETEGRCPDVSLAIGAPRLDFRHFRDCGSCGRSRNAALHEGRKPRLSEPSCKPRQSWGYA